MTPTKPITDERLQKLDDDACLWADDAIVGLAKRDYLALRERLRLAEAVVEAARWLEDAFDIRDTPKQAPAERKLARALAAYRSAIKGGPND